MESVKNWAVLILILFSNEWSSDYICSSIEDMMASTGHKTTILLFFFCIVIGSFSSAGLCLISDGGRNNAEACVQLELRL